MTQYTVAAYLRKPLRTVGKGLHYLQIEALNFIDAMDRAQHTVFSNGLEAADIIIECVVSGGFVNPTVHYDRLTIEEKLLQSLHA